MQHLCTFSSRRPGNEEIYLDAGSGIVGVKPPSDSRITILLTHLHLDHVTGLPFFDALKDKNRPIKIYAKTRGRLTAQAAFDRLISPPFWPLKLGDYPANVTFSDFSEKFFVGEVAVDTMEGKHPLKYLRNSDELWQEQTERAFGGGISAGTS